MYCVCLVFKQYVSCICSGFAASHWSTTSPCSRTATERHGEAWWSSSLRASSNSRTTGWVYNQAFHPQDHVCALFKLSSSCNTFIYRICLCLGISSARLSYILFKLSNSFPSFKPFVYEIDWLVIYGILRVLQSFNQGNVLYRKCYFNMYLMSVTNTLCLFQFKVHAAAYYQLMCEVIMFDLKLEMRSTLRKFFSRAGLVCHISTS